MNLTPEIISILAPVILPDDREEVMEHEGPPYNYRLRFVQKHEGYLYVTDSCRAMRIKAPPIGVPDGHYEWEGILGGEWKPHEHQDAARVDRVWPTHITVDRTYLFRGAELRLMARWKRADVIASDRHLVARRGQAEVRIGRCDSTELDRAVVLNGRLFDMVPVEATVRLWFGAGHTTPMQLFWSCCGIDIEAIAMEHYP